MKDPLFGASGVPGIACSATLTGNYTSCTNYNVEQVSGDTNYYIVTNNVDPNAHVQKSYDDTLGRAIYSLAYSGLYGHSPTANEQTTVQYNVLDEPTQVTETDLAPQSGQSITNVTATATYDSLGRVTQESDPDSGTHTYTYDANGQVLTDVSGTRTLGSNYDLLGRLGCLQDAAPTINATGACTSGTHPYEQDTYDVSAPGAQWGSTDYPIGHLTQSIATTYYPDGTSSTATENTQYDKRGRAITDQLKLALPSSWNITTALPTYQMASSYDDANQLTTVATSTVAANGNSTPGYTMTQVYDSTTGLLVGLGNTSSQVANLASVLYNENALVSNISFATNTGSATVASEQFSYDGDLRPVETNATWQSGSGTTGTILDQQRSYDPASNVISLSTTLAGVPGKSGSGGSETQNFCYDEQDRLVWAGNSGTQPAAGNGTCGSGTLSSNLSGAAYSNSFVYTHLGQLWQGPLNGGSTQYQYLYCNSTSPHQLNGMYPIGTTCSNLSGAVYKTSYDNWGNATSRTYNGTSTTQSFDLLDQLVKWNSGTTQKQWYAYNTSGERVLLRSTTSSATTMTVYPFGAEEYTYDGSGNLQSSTHYYDMGGRLIGELTGGSTPATNLFLTDELGSVLTTFSNVQNSAAVQGNQAYGPYGTQRYNQGSMGTNKGYTGQYADPLTGFDYYNARYYDPVAGVFLSADCTQGNMQGMNPYAYVGANPETNTDPTGEMYAPGAGGGDTSPPVAPPPPPSCYGWCWVQQQWNTYVAPYVAPVEHYAQQVEETVIRTVTSHIPLFVPILIGVAVAATIGGVAYAVWQFTHTDPNWSNVVTGNGVNHPHWHWFNQEGKFRPGIGINQGHVLRKHVNLNKHGLKNRATQIAQDTNQDGVATTFNNANVAQWTVDYALAHMTLAQKLQLLWMRGSPLGRFRTLTLTGNTGANIGWGYRVSPGGKVTKLTNLSSYVVVIGIDFQTGQPFIVTAFPTP